MRSGILMSSLTAVALVATSPAFAQQAPATMPPQGQMQRQTPPGQMAAPGQAQEQKLSEKDKNFAKEAAMGGMLEVELGTLAQQNASNDQVKQFGARMVQDHGDANEELMAILADKDMTAPQQLDQKHKQMIDRLSKMRGAEFDRTYMREMVEDHDKDVKKFRQQATQGNDADLKEFAQNTLPILEQHEKLAQDVNKSLTAVGSSGQAQGQRNR